MTDQVLAEWLGLYQSWSRTVASVVSGQLGLMAVPLQVSGKMLDNVLTVCATRGSRLGQASSCPARPAPRSAEELQRLVLERVRQGLPPPPEVYEVQNRDRIDWMQVPDWARPSDPELFEGCGHEG